MTHSLTLELPGHIYRGVIKEAEAKKSKVKKSRLSVLRKTNCSVNKNLNVVADKPADFTGKNMPPDAGSLSYYAMSRDRIDEDHLKFTSKISQFGYNSKCRKLSV